MNYAKLIAKLLEKATEKELERVYHFLRNYIKGNKK